MDLAFENVNIFDFNFILNSKYFADSAFNNKWISSTSSINTGNNSDTTGVYNNVYGSPFPYYWYKNSVGDYEKYVNTVEYGPMHDQMIINGSAANIVYFDQILQRPVTLEKSTYTVDYNPGFSYTTLEADYKNAANKDNYNNLLAGTYNMTAFYKIPSFMVFNCSALNDLIKSYSAAYDFHLANDTCSNHPEIGIHMGVSANGYTLYMDSSYLLLIIVQKDSLMTGTASKSLVLPYLLIHNTFGTASNVIASQYFEPSIQKMDIDYNQLLDKWVIFIVFGGMLAANMAIYMWLVAKKNESESNEINLSREQLKQSFPNFVKISE